MAVSSVFSKGNVFDRNLELTHRKKLAKTFRCALTLSFARSNHDTSIVLLVSARLIALLMAVPIPGHLLSFARRTTGIQLSERIVLGNFARTQS